MEPYMEVGMEGGYEGGEAFEADMDEGEAGEGGSEVEMADEASAADVEAMVLAAEAADEEGSLEASGIAWAGQEEDDDADAAEAAAHGGGAAAGGAMRARDDCTMGATAAARAARREAGGGAPSGYSDRPRSAAPAGSVRSAASSMGLRLSGGGGVTSGGLRVSCGR